MNGPAASPWGQSFGARVHEPAAAAPTEHMSPASSDPGRLFDASEPDSVSPFDEETVADMLEVWHAGDIDAAIAALEDLLAALRRAARVRRALATVSAETLRGAIQVRARRRSDGSPC